MFLNLFTALREAKVPVTLREHLMLVEALDHDLADYSVTEFYHLSRACLVKDERHLDRFDQVFGRSSRASRRWARRWRSATSPRTGCASSPRST